MSEAPIPRLSKAPFWIADVLLVGAAAALVTLGARPLRVWEMVAVTVCVALGGWLAVLPFLREYDAGLKFAETDRLADTMARLGQLDLLADRIAGATSQWQSVQEHAGKTADLANGIVERLAREAESFAGAVSRTADGEKQTLKLEIDKLRRLEGEWLQAVGRLMDHVYALHVAAVRSGQPGLADQIDRFHGACRDSLRRVGFIPIVAAPDETFDPRRHQAADGSRPSPGAQIDETVAPGFVFQGQLLRPIVVKLVSGQSSPAAEDSKPAGAPGGGLGPETESLSLSGTPENPA